MLVENGLKLNEAMWADCQKRLGTSQARDEYGPLDRFIEYSLNEKGTHVSEVAKRIRIALAAGRPLHVYKVGPDSRATPSVGPAARARRRRGHEVLGVWAPGGSRGCSCRSFFQAQAQAFVAEAQH